MKNEERMMNEARIPGMILVNVSGAAQGSTSGSVCYSTYC